MGERKGQNKYYPPDYDPKKGGLNKWQGTHALRERANKLHLGILIIRFEMPFNVWCEGCGNHVGMGVRYNAEKKKVGMYYTTPLYEFKMKCHLCSNYFVIRTDPKNFDYELVEGVRRQENRWDMAENEQQARTAKNTNKKLATDAMFKLEYGEDDISKSKQLNPTLIKLQKFQNRWKDDFALNQELRRTFRTQKKETNEREKEDVLLLKKSSLNLKLLPESSEDKRLASLITQYKTVKTSDEKQQDLINKLDTESIFDNHHLNQPGCSKTQSISECLLKGRGVIQKRKSQLIDDSLERSIKKSLIRNKAARIDKDRSSIQALSNNYCKEAAEKNDCKIIGNSGLATLCAAYDVSSDDSNDAK